MRSPTIIYINIIFHHFFQCGPYVAFCQCGRFVAGRFVAGPFVPGRYVAGRFVAGRFVADSCATYI